MSHEDWMTADEVQFVLGLGYHAPKRQWCERRDEPRGARVQRLLRQYLATIDARDWPALVDLAAVRQVAQARLEDFAG